MRTNPTSSFAFHMQTAIVFSQGAADSLSSILSEYAIGKRLLLVTDPGVKRAGLIDPIVSQLEKAQYEVSVFSTVAQNPRDDDCLLGASYYKENGCAAVLAIGGGSAMDTAKTIALLATHGGTPSAYADGLLPYGQTPPIICVPTTAGTGSEVTRSAVITEASTHRKMTLKHAYLRPLLAVLDPLLTLSVPPAVTAATGVDALVHAIEGSTCLLRTPISQAFGEQAMRLIMPHLERAVADGQDVAARTAMLQGSLLAGLCFGSTDVAAVHCLAEALGGLYDTPHGVANAVCLPVVMRFNASEDQPVHTRLASVLGFASSHQPPDEAIRALVDGIANWTRALGIPRLRDLPRVTPVDFDALAELAFANSSTASNIRPINKGDYRLLLEQAYSER